MGTRRKFSAEYKREAVAMVDVPGVTVTSPGCFDVMTRQDMIEHTIQRQTITSQRLGGLMGSYSIARSSVLLCAVSPRVLPEAVTPVGATV